MLREDPVFKEGSLPLGKDLAAHEELQILEGSPRCIFFNICWTWRGLRFYAWKMMLRGLFHETKTAIMTEMRN